MKITFRTIKKRRKVEQGIVLLFYGIWKRRKFTNQFSPLPFIFKLRKNYGQNKAFFFLIYRKICSQFRTP